FFFFFSSRRRHTRSDRDWSSDVCSSDLTAVRPDGTVIEDEVRRLIVRRHRHSPEVASVVGADWAERKEPQNWLVPASSAENAVRSEERRVGKECRSRGWAWCEKKKKNKK